MRSRTARLALVLALLFLSLPAAARSHRRSRKSPHAEIGAVARVETAPERRVHKNRREFEEFDIVIERFDRLPEGDTGGDPELPVDTSSRVHVVHDLSCGGVWVDLAPGDRIEVKGEYVNAGKGRDLIHFTHPADASCGDGKPHPGGSLKKKSG